MTVIIIAAAAAALFALGLFAAECVWLRREMLPAPAPDLTRGGLEKTRFARYAGTIVPDVLELRALPWEDVYMSSFDGLRLHARLVRGGDDAVVLMHGFRSSIEDDFAGIAQWYVRRGFTVIAADERAHGLSEGGNISPSALRSSATPSPGRSTPNSSWAARAYGCTGRPWERQA